MAGRPKSKKPQPPRVTDAERERIIGLLRDGMSQERIAREVGRGVGTVARIAKAAGITAEGRTAEALARARAARSAFCAERRAELAARLQVEAELLLDELHGPFEVYSFGGRDNTFASRLLDNPPQDAKESIIRSAQRCVTTMLAIDKHDNRADGDVSAVADWLRAMTGAA